MDVSVIVLTFNSVSCIEECVASALNSLTSANLDGELIVFDNGSSDGTVQILQNLERKFANVTVFYSAENLGTTRSRNRAIRNTTGKYLLVLDSDAFITRECLEGMLQHLLNNPRCGLVGPRLTYKSGNFQLSYDSFPTLQRKLSRLFRLRSIERSAVIEGEFTNVDYLISACWMMSREMFQQVGPLDENIFYAPEDADYCMRVWKSGYEVHYLPNVSMVHDAQELSRSVRINKFALLHLAGLIY